MEQQHAIPQQISSYQFRLVGDMTLKQFFQLAGGALVSLLFYASKLPPLIKWPFVIFFALLGVALAFLPFQERPLEKWIIAFFRSIYSPTLFYWQQAQAPFSFFQAETAPVAPAPSEKPISGYILPISAQGTIFSKLEGAEKTFLSSVSQLFTGSAPQLMPTGQMGVAGIPTPPQKGAVPVPENLPTYITKTGLKPQVVVEEKPLAPTPQAEMKTSVVTPTVGYQRVAAGRAQFSIEAAPPNPPTVANTVVGQIFDAEGKIVNGAILEIRDAAGRPVRALKSNMLGHFIIVTPLVDGTYKIIAEKEGLNFDPISFEASGEIIPPIAIRAKGTQKILTTEELVSSKAVAQT
jgi:hypothetical protein